jgi:hypothetical protein
VGAVQHAPSRNAELQVPVKRPSFAVNLRLEKAFLQSCTGLYGRCGYVPSNAPRKALKST